MKESGFKNYEESVLVQYSIKKRCGKQAETASN